MLDTINYQSMGISILSLVLNILLIPLWDITGSAIATLLTQIAYWLIILYYSEKHFHIPYEYRKLALVFITGALISFSVLFINEYSLMIRMLTKLLLVVAFPFILYILKFYEKNELLAIRGFIKKWKNLRKLGDNLKSLKNISDISGL